MRLLLDEMLSSAVAEQLRSRGFDVEAVEGLAEVRGSPDLDLFEYAQREEQAIVTYDRDFLALVRGYHDEGRDHNGIVIVNARRFPQAAATTGALVDSLEAFVRHGPPYPSFVHWLQ